MGNPIEKIKSLFAGWIFGKGIKKGVKVAVAAIIGLVSSAKVAAILTQLGVTIDQAQLEAGATVFVTGLVGTLLNWVKVRFKIDWI